MKYVAALMVALALVCVAPVSAKAPKTTKQTQRDTRAEKARYQMEQDLKLRGSMIPWKHSR